MAQKNKAELAAELEAARTAAGVEGGTAIDEMTKGQMVEELEALAAGAGAPARPEPKKNDKVRVTSLRNGPRIVAEPARILEVHADRVLDCMILDKDGKDLREVKGVRQGTLREKKPNVWIEA